jgi:hypothetical protein
MMANVTNKAELIRSTKINIWWLRRRQSHGDQVPPIRHCINSIRAITSNAGRAMTPETSVKKNVWLKPRASNLKLNVDAAFSIETHSGAIGADICFYIACAICCYGGGNDDVAWPSSGKPNWM